MTVLDMSLPDPRQSWTSSHIFGSCLVNHYRRLFWVNIPKCASTWGKQYFTAPQWSRLNSEDFWDGGNFTGVPTAESIMPGTIDSSYRAIIWLRDPVSRWISAAPSWHKILPDQEPFDRQGVLEGLIDATLDEHAAPQSDFIQGINLDRAVFFRCDHSLTTVFQHYAHHNTFACSAFPAKSNMSDKNTNRLYGEKWKALLQHADIEEAFRQCYRKDYDLIDSVKFYDVDTLQ